MLGHVNKRTSPEQLVLVWKRHTPHQQPVATEEGDRPGAQPSEGLRCGKGSVAGRRGSRGVAVRFSARVG
eukprot:365377-Chlamydomonas_euryale.AAC.7